MCRERDRPLAPESKALDPGSVHALHSEDVAHVPGLAGRVGVTLENILLEGHLLGPSGPAGRALQVYLGEDEVRRGERQRPACGRPQAGSDDTTVEAAVLRCDVDVSAQVVAVLGEALGKGLHVILPADVGLEAADGRHLPRGHPYP